MIHTYSLVWGVLIFTSLSFVFVSNALSPESTHLKIINFAGAAIQMYWVDTISGDNDVQSIIPPRSNGGAEIVNRISSPKLVKQFNKPLRNDSSTDILSYNTHEFLLRFADHIPGIEVPFVKGAVDEVLTVMLNTSTNSLYFKVSTAFDELQETADNTAKTCEGLSGKEYVDCIIKTIEPEVQRITRSTEHIEKHRDLVSARLRNYTCADTTQMTSKPLSSYIFNHEGKSYRTQVFLNMTHAKIWMADNFITDAECKVLEEHGRPKLTRATVAAEDGTSVVSEHRKAQQASYKEHQKGMGEDDPLWKLQGRILAMTNSHAGMNLERVGQEGFTIIQYNVDDQYTPHCDGTCDHTAHVPTGRVATAVMYCQVPELGGATIFTKADVYIKPKVGSVTFFSYKGADGLMDEGYTEHSGCPVLQGEKWITTFWMRDGVSAEMDATQFDPSGLRILDE